MNDVKSFLIESWWVGVKRVNGVNATEQALKKNEIASIQHILAIGKAAASMYLGARTQLGDDHRSLVITKYNHAEELLGLYPSTKVIESDHPIPDENSLIAGKAAIEFVSQIPPNDSLLLLISGGASALVEALPDEMTLDQLKQLTDSMLAEGIDIHEINRQRRLFSKIKGGKLLDYFSGSAVYSFAISDVPGDDMDVIGSGIGSLSESAKSKLDYLYQGEVIASNRIARNTIDQWCSNSGLIVQYNSDGIDVDVNEAAKIISKIINEGKPGVYIWGGEPTVKLPDNPGHGGRNQHLALLLAKSFAASRGISILVAGTDGTDGKTSNAGGVINGQTWDNSDIANNLLEQANSANFLQRANAVFQPGPTGTNVMDIVIAIKQP